MPRRKSVPHLLAPVGIAFAAEGTVIEPDGVAVIKGAKNRDNGLTRFKHFAAQKRPDICVIPYAI